MTNPQTLALAQALDQFADLIARRLHDLQTNTQPSHDPGEAVSPWMGVERAAAYLDWPKQRLYKLTAQGAIPHYKHDRRLLFNRHELDRWLTHHAQPTTPTDP